MRRCRFTEARREVSLHQHIVKTPTAGAFANLMEGPASPAIASPGQSDYVRCPACDLPNRRLITSYPQLLVRPANLHPAQPPGAVLAAVAASPSMAAHPIWPVLWLMH